MRGSFSLTTAASDEITLRTIQKADCENLRMWKNSNRAAFFFQGIIIPEGQRQWFKQYLDRSDDYMFMVVYQNEDIGCMGFRLLDGQVDIYNVILGRREFGGKGLMGRAMMLMCGYINHSFQCRIRVKALCSNLSAIRWYKKNRFKKVDENDKFLKLELAREKISNDIRIRLKSR